MGILFRGNSPWDAACLSNSIVTMTKTSVLFIYLGNEVGAEKMWEKKIMLREINLATGFGI